jgi:MFS family permease
MESFLQAFFPEILRKTNNAQQDAYCIFRNQELTMFVSSLYLAAILSSLVSGHLTRTVGRRNSMLIGGFLFLAGVVLNFTAVNISMLVIGRILLGLAVGFTSLVITAHQINAHTLVVVIVTRTDTCAL